MSASWPPSTGGRSGVDAVLGAADHMAAEHQHAIDQNAELHCRIQELETENRELRERIEELLWDFKDREPRALGQ